MSSNIPAITPSGIPDLKPAVPGASDAGKKFFETLQGAIGEVNRLQTEAQAKVADLVGNNGEDVHQTMIAVEKADVAFQLMMQVRNKIVQAYQEVSRMAF